MKPGQLVESSEEIRLRLIFNTAADDDDFTVCGRLFHSRRSGDGKITLAEI